MGKKKSNAVSDMMSCTMNNPALVAQLKALGFESKNPDGMTFEEAMICSQISMAVRGDYKAYQTVMGMRENEAVSPLEKFLEENTVKAKKEPKKGQK